MLRFQIHESLTHFFRCYWVSPVTSELADALLTIQLGEPGPRGGTSHISVETYQVQESLPDPAEKPRGREFLLLRESRRRVPGSRLEEQSVYLVRVPPRGMTGSCTCRGAQTGHRCKHLDVLEHLVYVVGGWDEQV